MEKLITTRYCASCFPNNGRFMEKTGREGGEGEGREVSVKQNIHVYFCVVNSRYFSTAIHRVIDRLKKSFNLTWLRVQMSYHIFNNLAELLNGDLAAKIGQGTFSKDLMDRECNSSLPYKVNGKCVYEGKYR